MGAAGEWAGASTNTGGIDEGKKRSFLVRGRVCAGDTTARRELVERLTTRQSGQEDCCHHCPQQQPVTQSLH